MVIAGMQLPPREECSEVLRLYATLLRNVSVERPAQTDPLVRGLDRIVPCPNVRLARHSAQSCITVLIALWQICAHCGKSVCGFEL
jgi:hypothetical protein